MNVLKLIFVLTNHRSEDNVAHFPNNKRMIESQSIRELVHTWYSTCSYMAKYMPIFTYKREVGVVQADTATCTRRLLATYMECEEGAWQRFCW